MKKLILAIVALFLVCGPVQAARWRGGVGIIVQPQVFNPYYLRNAYDYPYNPYYVQPYVQPYYVPPYNPYYVQPYYYHHNNQIQNYHYYDHHQQQQHHHH